MLIENDAVDAETTEEAADAVVVGDATDKGETIEPVTGDIETPAAMETADTPEAEVDSNSEGPSAAKTERVIPPKRKKHKKQPTNQEIARVTSWFAACGRCSFFLAGYTVAGGEGALETAVAYRGNHWLYLNWSHAVANLVHKSYGSRVDIQSYHFEGRCQECQRRFVYDAADEHAAPIFQIELKTRSRK